jgi:hypothetical protein
MMVVELTLPVEEGEEVLRLLDADVATNPWGRTLGRWFT